MERLKNKCALVMGATSGIGQTCAEMFAREGARVVLTGRRVAHGEAVARSIVAAGGDAAFQLCDVTQPESVEEAVRQATARLGRLDILLSNAGGSGNADGPVTIASLDEFWNKMRVDHFGTFLSLRFAIPEMVKSGGWIGDQHGIGGRLRKFDWRACRVCLVQGGRHESDSEHSACLRQGSSPSQRHLASWGR